MGCGASVDEKRIKIEKMWFEAAAATGDPEGVSTLRRVHHLPENLISGAGSPRIVPVDCPNPGCMPIVDGERSQGWTALLIAAACGNVRGVKELLEQECDVNIDIDRGSTGTALAFAAERFNRPAGDNYKEIVNILLENKSHTMRNLIESGTAARPRSEEACDLIWNEAKSREFDPDGLKPGHTAVEGLTEMHYKRYNQWLQDKAAKGDKAQGDDEGIAL